MRRSKQKLYCFQVFPYVVHAARRLNYIKVTFPVRGHSYLECDRNMTLVNQKHPAELLEYWMEAFQSACIKPSPYHIVHVDEVC